MYGLPYFEFMFKDIYKAVNTDDLLHLVRIANKHGLRSWTVDVFSNILVNKHFEEFNDIVEFYCEHAGVDLSDYKYPVRYMEFNIILNDIVINIIKEYREMTLTLSSLYDRMDYN